jgi:hypothetical protein
VESSAREELLRLAEEPDLVLPPAPGREVLVRGGYVFTGRTRRGSVERLRLDDVEGALAEVRSLARDRGFDYVTWWVGALATPADAYDRLRQLGLEPDPDMPVSTTLTIAELPAGELCVEVRPVESPDDYLRAREIGWTVWPEPRDEQDDWRAAWTAEAASGRSRHFLAFLDGEAVGFGRSVYTARAVMLMGGAVLPHARGRGAYVSLVHARWNDAVARGVPRLLVGAGAMSAPILMNLGFERIGEVRLLRDSL